MAVISDLRDDSLPSIATGVSVLQKVLAIAADQANNADRIEVFEVPVSAEKRLVGAQVRTSATLGAGTTLQLRVNRDGVFTNVTAATTAAVASKVTDVAQADMPFDLEGGDIIELLVGGADISAAATVTVDLFIADRPRD